MTIYPFMTASRGKKKIIFFSYGPVLLRVPPAALPLFVQRAIRTALGVMPS
jgi:hypothetical protein